MRSLFNEEQIMKILKQKERSRQPRLFAERMEMTPHAALRRCQDTGAGWCYTAPGDPMQIVFVESFIASAL